VGDLFTTTYLQQPTYLYVEKRDMCETFLTTYLQQPMYLYVEVTGYVGDLLPPLRCQCVDTGEGVQLTI
jgi:hypothetical protein